MTGDDKMEDDDEDDMDEEESGGVGGADEDEHDEADEDMFMWLWRCWSPQSPMPSNWWSIWFTPFMFNIFFCVYLLK